MHPEAIVGAMKVTRIRIYQFKQLYNPERLCPYLKDAERKKKPLSAEFEGAIICLEREFTGIHSLVPDPDSRERQFELPPVLHRDLRDSEVLDCSVLYRYCSG